ncbi:hypothetical protein VTK26DRAFT_5630 [Humicola hyalothermophila]
MTDGGGVMERDQFNFADPGLSPMPGSIPPSSATIASGSTPNAHGSVPLANAPAAPHKPPRILACVLCQTRKIKCDRNFPCANCIKANVKCTPSTPAPARKRKRPNQDLQERLARCEELLKEYATEKPEAGGSRSGVNATDDPYAKFQFKGKLIREDGSMRFVDSPLMTVFDEVRAMREIIEVEDNDECSPEAMTPDGNSDMLLGSGDSPNSNVEALWPEPNHVFYLWQSYLDRVNPLTKIIHVPTLQPYIAEAVGGRNVPKNVEALLFSIFVMAVVSLTPDECWGMLGCPREEAMQRYSRGVRLSLVKVGFLKSHDLTTLQALVIYLISLQNRYNRHAAWILNGIAIRMAQKMGLHRDGETLGLPPFETEMRRRLWWQIIMVDAKYAMLSGLSHSLLPRNGDTKAPMNLNDEDMHPGATEPFQEREGPTEMIFCLLLHRFGKFLVETPGFETLVLLPEADGEKPRSGPTEKQLAEYRRSFEQLGKELVDIIDKNCDPKAGAIHELAIEMRKHLVDKIQELITPPKLRPDWGGEVRSAKDNTFKIAINSFEHNEVNYISAKDKGFAWFSLLHFNLDVFMYMAGQLCQRTEGSLVERAWKQVDAVYSYHPELFDLTNKNYAAVAVYVLKAWKKREETIFMRTGTLPDPPFYVEKLRASMPNDDYKSEPTPQDPYTPVDLTGAAHHGTAVGGLRGGSVGGPGGGMGGSGPSSSTSAATFSTGLEDGLDQFFGGFLDDAQPVDWEMLGNQSMSGAPPLPTFGPFGMGPALEW